MEQIGLFKKQEIPTYLLSVRGGSANALMEGNKPHEFRRKFDDYSGKIRVFLYVIRPVGKIIGQVIFDTPIKGSIGDLITLLEDNSYDNEKKLREYLTSCNTAYALPLVSSKRFENPISLEEIRKLFPEFNPPVSYFRLDKRKYHSIRNYLLNRQ